MRDTVRWGILANAWIARDYMIPAMQKSKLCEVTAIASRSELPQDFLPGLKHYKGYEAMLADPAIDAVYVPTPNALHARGCLDAMRAGKHVLCEKPLTMNAAQCEELMRTAEECGVLLMEAFMYGYGEKTRLLNEILDLGVLGEVRGLRAVHGYTLDWASPARQDPALGGGCLYDVGCYCVNFLNSVMRHAGHKPQAADARFVMQDGVDVHMTGLITYDNGVSGSLECWFDGAQHQAAAVFGEKGVLYIPNAFDDEAPATLTLRTAAGEQRFEVAPADNYQKEADAFSAAILGKSARLHPLADTLSDMRTIDMLYAHKAR